MLSLQGSARLSYNLSLQGSHNTGPMPSVALSLFVLVQPPAPAALTRLRSQRTSLELTTRLWTPQAHAFRGSLLSRSKLITCLSRPCFPFFRPVQGTCTSQPANRHLFQQQDSQSPRARATQPTTPGLLFDLKWSKTSHKWTTGFSTRYFSIGALNSQVTGSASGTMLH